jgi:hypothetical protein
VAARAAPRERRVLSDHAPVEVTIGMTPAEARALFPVFERITYLNAGTFGPLARPTAESVEQQLRADLELGRRREAVFRPVLASASRAPRSSRRARARRARARLADGPRRRTAATSCSPGSASDRTTRS